MVRITDAIAKDHRLLESYYETIVSAEDAEEQTRYQNQFTWELARHSVAEDLVVYPAMKKYLRNGDQPVDKDRKEHQTVRMSDRVKDEANSTIAQRTLESFPELELLRSALHPHDHHVDGWPL
jgi:hemerythrin superfamily protein